MLRKHIRGVEVITPLPLNLKTTWSNSCPDSFTPGKETLYHPNRKLSGPTASLKV
jgi:hypothetical protein